VNALNSMCKAWPMCSIDKEWIGNMREQSAACSMKAHSASGGFVPLKPFFVRALGRATAAVASSCCASQKIGLLGFLIGLLMSLQGD